MPVRIGSLEIPEHLLAISPHIRAMVGAVEKRARGARWRSVVEATARRDGQRVTVVAKGLRLVSELNTREHDIVRAKRAAWQREVIASALRGVEAPSGPYVVSVVRRGPRSLDRHDNLGASAKHVIDAIAAWLCVDDGTEGFVCDVQQERGDYLVSIAVEVGAATRGGG